MSNFFKISKACSKEDIAKDEEFYKNNPPLWRCYSCGTTSDKTAFYTVKTWTDYGYEYDVECDECGSEHTAADGEGSPECECGKTYGWWCDKCNICLCEECWKWFSALEEPIDYICKECG